ncbi:MAG: hypothetical protein ACI8QZ_002391 [Chlamydiales bacterium]|jgi:hypothetical protein
MQVLSHPSNPGQRLPNIWRRRHFAGLLVVLLATAGLAHAAAPGQNQKALKRIFTLESGATVRAIARQTDGVWEFQRGSDWAPAPWPIEQVRLEREVLAEMRRLASKLPSNARVAQRCELADWMLRNGLILEALEELNPLITETTGIVHGSSAGTRARTCASMTLERHAFRFALPEVIEGATDTRSALAPVFVYAASASPAMRELCAQKLAQHGDADGVHRVLLESLLDSNPSRRSWSAFALGQLSPGEQLPALLQRAVLDPSESVRTSAQSALRAAHEPALVAPIARALAGSTSARVRVHAAEALGHIGYAAAFPSLITRLAALEGTTGTRVQHSNIFVGRQAAYLQDFDVEVSQGQAVADPQLNVLVEGQVTDVGVISEQQVTLERRRIRSALERLAGARPGRTSKAWASWWDANSERVLSDPNPGR